VLVVSQWQFCWRYFVAATSEVGLSGFLNPYRTQCFWLLECFTLC
jgi:hypothetical protein